MNKSMNHCFTKDDFLSNRTRRIKKGTHLLYAGTKHQNNCFLILKGSLSICLISAGGHEMLLYHLREHQLIGELAMFGEATRSATAIADEDSLLLEISEKEFKEKLKDYTFLKSMTDIFLQRYLKTHDVVCRLSQPNISMKICHYVKSLADQVEGKEKRVRVLMPSHGELAMLISCQRETITREMKKLVNQGVVVKDTGSWFYVDRNKANAFLSEQ